MRILHYTLGLPPYRSGGLTKYATDLMLYQSKSGDQVSLLYPGCLSIFNYNKTFIKDNSPFEEVSIFEIVNPSILPLLHGVKSPKKIYQYRNKISEKELAQFFSTVKPEIFHIHTLMGLPFELLSYLKSKGVKFIFTTHDYYGLCPKVNFINNNNELCLDPSGNNCSECNMYAPSNLFLRIRNSQLLHKLKSHIELPVKQKSENIINNSEKKKKASPDSAKQYTELLEYYKNIFSYIDHFHFNSSITSDVFRNLITTENTSIIPITHAGIKDKRNIKHIESKTVRIGFIGSTDFFKGLPLLKNALLELEKKGLSNWELLVFGSINSIDKQSSKIKYFGKFTYSDIKNIFSNMDCLIVPSICKETFSLVSLEAISYGVPVFTSYNVGAKDILTKYKSNETFAPTLEGISNTINNILTNPNILTNYRNEIIESTFSSSLEIHVNQIKNLYLELIN